MARRCVIWLSGLSSVGKTTIATIQHPYEPSINSELNVETEIEKPEVLAGHVIDYLHRLDMCD